MQKGKPKTIEISVKLALEFEAFRESRKPLNPHRLNKAPMRVQIEEPIQENKMGIYSQNRPRDPRRNQKLCIYCTKRGHLEHECYLKKIVIELQQSEVKKITSEPGKLLGAGEMGQSPATENRPKVNKDDYEGMFLLAEIGGIAVNRLIDRWCLIINNTPSSVYSTVQAFFHQPAHPRGEGATIKRISPPRKPPAGGDCGGSAAFPRWVLHIKIDGQSLPVFKVSWSPPRVRGGIK